MAASVRTPIGVLSFPVLFSPRPRAPGQEPCYQCSLLFDQTAQKDPAFELLRSRARASNRSVVDLAHAVLDGHALLPNTNGD